MTEDKYKILEEKIQYLISSALTEKNFEVISIHADISTYTPKPTGSETPKELIDEYDINLVVDYNGSIDSFAPHDFTRDIKKMCDLMRNCVAQYTITKNGKIVRGDNEAYVSDAFIMGIDFEYEELHKFSVNFKITHHE
jgi:hypothetical protein